MVRPLDAGDLRSRVQLVRRTATTNKDEANRFIYTTSVVWTTRAAVVSLSGQEVEQARTLVPSASYRVSVRQPPPQVTISMQDWWIWQDRGKTLQIGHASSDPERRTVDTICGETL